MTVLSVERRMWSLFEPVHAVTYFAPTAGAAPADNPIPLRP